MFLAGHINTIESRTLQSVRKNAKCRLVAIYVYEEKAAPQRADGAGRRSGLRLLENEAEHLSSQARKPRASIRDYRAASEDYREGGLVHSQEAEIRNVELLSPKLPLAKVRP